MKTSRLWLYFAAAGALLGLALVLYLLGRVDAAAAIGTAGGLGLGGAIRSAARVDDARATIREQVVASRRRQASERVEARAIEARVKREQAESAKAAVDRVNARFSSKDDE